MTRRHNDPSTRRPADATPGSRVRESLIGLRRRIRWVLLAEGVGWLLAACGGGLLLACAADYALRLPPALRFILLLAGLMVWAWACWRRVVHPLTARIGLPEIAVAVDGRFTELEDRIGSAVDFAARQQIAEGGMMDRVVRQAEEAIGGLPLGTMVRTRPAVTAGTSGAFLVAAVAGVMWVVPWFISTGVRRFVSPFGGVEWPRRVHLVPVTGDARRPAGEWFEARATVDRGADASLRVFVTRETGGGRRERVAASSDAATGQYYHMWTDLDRDFSYWFEAGDDTTIDRGRFRVRVIPRPAITETELRITDPPYVSGGSPRVAILGDSPVSVMEGSSLRLAFRTSKAIARDAQGRPQAWLILPGGSTLSLGFADGSHRRLAGSFEAVRGGSLSVRVVDEDGFENRGGAAGVLAVRADEPPRVVITEPAAAIEVTPEATVEAVLAVEDDFGVKRLSVEAVVDRKPDRPARFDLSDRVGSRRGEGKHAASVNWSWDLRPMQLQSGDGVAYHASVEDNFELGGRRHPPVSSSTMRLKVISPEQFADRIREELLGLKGAVRQILTAQESAVDQTEAILADVNKAAGNDRRRERATQAAARQSQLGGRAAQLSGRFADVARRMDANRARETDIRDRSRSIAGSLTSVSRGPMNTGADRLQQAAQPGGDVKERAGDLAAAKAAQEAAVAGLRSVLAEMDRWGDLQDVLRQAQYLLDQQEKLSESTAQLGRRTMGRRPEELSQPLAAEVDQQARQQRQLGDDVGRMTENMARVAERLSKSDASTASLLNAALQAAESGRIRLQMGQAADAIAGNRMTQAQTGQKAAEEALRQVLSTLERRSSEDLAVLNRQIRDAAARVEAMLGDQRKLREQTDGMKASPDASRSDALSQRQEGLSRSARAVGEQVAKMKGAEGSTRSVAQAADRMTAAAGRLGRNDPAGAVPEQDEAIRRLTESLEELRKMGTAAEAEQAAGSTLAMAEELKRLRTVQKGANDQLKEIVDATPKGGEIRRADLRRVDRLADQERQAATDLDKLRKQAEGARVYDYVMGQVGRDMRSLAGRLDERRVDVGSRRMGETILRRLDDLLSGMAVRPADSPDAAFAEGGGGQGGSQGKVKPVPTLAELVVLKSLQAEINRRTADLDLSGALGGAQTEGRLEEVRQLGLEQERVRQLTEEVCRRAMQ